MQMRLSVLAAICTASIPAVSLAEPPPNWSYTGKDGAEHWGDLSPVYAACRLGKNQSPVDLSDIKTTRDNSVKFHYEPLAFNVENNGHTIQVTPEESAQTLHLGNKAFTFKQFHFHTPSEHTFHAKYFPMEAHFVHQSDAGELAVLGVMFKEGEENPALQPLLAKSLKAGDKIKLDGKLDVMPLFPEGQSHFRLNGSLTTPPCSEGVNWIVFKTPVNASKAQLDAMRQMIGQDNNRPVQPLNARIVVEE